MNTLVWKNDNSSFIQEQELWVFCLDGCVCPLHLIDATHASYPIVVIGHMNSFLNDVDDNEQDKSQRPKCCIMSLLREHTDNAHKQ